MSQSIYCSPSLVIDNIESPYQFNFKIDKRGNSSINKASIDILSTKMNHSKLFNREVCIYLNYGSTDNVPMFRGYITEINPSDKGLKIIAMDARCFLAGENTPKVNSFDYHGYTLAQFTYEWITTKVNKDKVLIGTDMINETTPVQPFFSSEPTLTISDAYQLIKTGTLLNRDKEGKRFLRYEVVMIDDGIKSNIHFLRDKDLNGPTSATFSDTDGIISIRYKKDPQPTFIKVGGLRYQIGSQPNGPHLLKNDFLPPLDDYGNEPAAIQDALIEQLEAHRVWNEKTITITISKGHYLDLGDIVYLDVEDDELRGPHKVTSKVLDVKKNKLQSTLTLSKRIQSEIDF